MSGECYSTRKSTCPSKYQNIVKYKGVNSGVPLVLAMFSFQTGSDQLQGGFYPSYYGIQPGAIKYGPRAFLGSFDSGHPIMSGVTDFDGGIDRYKQIYFITLYSYRPSTTAFPNVAVVLY
jgi:hypothetical protein